MRAKSSRFSLDKYIKLRSKTGCINKKSYDLGDIREVMEYHNGEIWCSGNAENEKEESHTGADQEDESVE